nr:glycerophosphodiester phosphodiesterase family protein [Motilibacter aurantiacus]
MRADFDDNVMPAGWRPIEGIWAVRDGRLHGTSASSSQQARITFGEHLSDYRVEATVRFETVQNTGRWSAVALDMPADGSRPWWIATMRTGSTASNGLEFAQMTTAGAWNVTNTAAAPAAAGTGKDVRVAVEVHGSRAAWFFNGTKVMSTSALQRSAAGVLGLVLNGAQASYDDIVVTKLDPEPVIVPDDPGALPAVIAHRGDSYNAPENTLAAFESAIRNGADWVEIDVQTTRDGVPVVMHDNTVDRTTAGTGDISTLTAAQVAQLEAGSWFSAAAYPGQKVPTLTDVLDQMRGRASKLLLEVKGPETQAEVERVVAAIKSRGQTSEVLLQSFDVNVLRHARAADPDLRLGLLRSSLDADPVALSKELGLTAYNPSWDALKSRPGIVASLHEAGIAVMVWTVDDTTSWEQLRVLGVDGIITNKAGQLAGWQDRFTQALAGKPTVQVLAPAAGAQLTRGDTLTLAVAEQDAETLSITLDGTPVQEGRAIDVDTLALGAHTVSVTAAGEGGVTTTTAQFSVVPTAEGLASLLATPQEVKPSLRRRMLDDIDKQDWAQLVDDAESHAGRGVPGPLAALLAADARALLAAGR